MTILDADKYYIPKGKIKQIRHILQDNIRTLIENRDQIRQQNPNDNRIRELKSRYLQKHTEIRDTNLG